VVRPGIYREGTLRVERPLVIEGQAGSVLDGEGSYGLLVVAADSVTIRGLTFRNTGYSQVEDRAALRVDGARHCRVEQNSFEDTFFAIYLARASNCTVAGNRISGVRRAAFASGNGIHLWQSDSVTISGNQVAGHRDGIYFEFVRASTVRDNSSEHNERYGLHFMFSGDCRYENNTFRFNGAGIAVMYTQHVVMYGNRFEHNWGGAAYGLLLKDISDSQILENIFVENSVGLYLEGSNRNRVEGNEFRGNGWALKALASSQDNLIRRNIFVANTFDVATNSRRNFNRFEENYWDRYRGYDLDGDGYGDVPHSPVRLFALIAEQAPPALILLRSVIVDLLDLAERVLPFLTPAELVDNRPLMRSLVAGPGLPAAIK
jgi:nitrous oxidase accessory protein